MANVKDAETDRQTYRQGKNKIPPPDLVWGHKIPFYF